MQTRVELDHYPDFQDDRVFVTELIAEQGVMHMYAWIGKSNSCHAGSQSIV